MYEREGHNFRPRFYPVFQLLLARKQASVSAIASHLQVSQPAATQTLAEMKRLRFIVLEAGADRRERLVKLTPHALETIDALQPIWDAVEQAAAQLDDELSHPLSKIIDEANAALSRESFPDRIAKHRSVQGETE